MSTVKELKDRAKGLKIKNFSTMKKDELTVAIHLACQDHGMKANHDSPEETHEKISTPAPKTKPRQSWFSGEARVATVLLIAIGFTLAYLTRPDPTWYENLMAYLPF